VIVVVPVKFSLGAAKSTGGPSGALLFTKRKKLRQNTTMTTTALRAAALFMPQRVASRGVKF
jgi:hypothetical protein